MLLSRHPAGRVLGSAPKQPASRQRVVVAARRTRKASEAAQPGNVSEELTDDQKAKKRIIAETIAKINAKHGANTVMQMTDGAVHVARTPTGCLTLDKATGGGYPKGRIVEIYGPEASGKTTLALHAIAEIQKLKGNCLFIDAEHAFDSAYATCLGIDVPNLLICQPDHGEQAFNVMDECVRSGGVELIVVDSVSALMPKSEVEGDIGTPQVGSQARLMSAALRKIAANASRSDCTIIFINQLRMKIGVMFGNPETTSGGNALKYYATMRLDIRAKDKIMETGKAEPVGNKVKVKVVKNKISAPYEVAEFDIMYGDGINALGCIFDVAKDMGVIEGRGHYNFEGVKLAHGRDNALAFLKENPDTAARIAQAVKVKLAEARNASRNKSDDITDKLQKLDEDEESNGDEDLDGDSSAAELTEHIDAL